MGAWMIFFSAACGGAAAPATGDDAAVLADVVAVAVAGDQLAVTVRSPETGCAQYADWWEVITPAGELVYRRVLNHSHPDEQPFTRSGGPVSVDATETLIVRAHMHPGGYGGAALQGSLAGGFGVASEAAAGVAVDLAEQAPLPDGCAF